MRRYVLSKAADRHLDQIWAYIALDSESAADAWIAKLFETFEFLGNNPDLGRSRAAVDRPDLKFWPVGDYLVLYWIRPRRIQIAAVTHGARDIPKFVKRGF